ncbi:hypothetical protein Tco_0676400 [Tanacetum coccineum]
MSTLTFVDTHNMVAFLEKPAESDGFHEIIDFLNANQINYALTVNPTIYTSCIEQFWATAKAKMVNGEHQLQAPVDKKKVKEYRVKDQQSQLTPIIHPLVLHPPYNHQLHHPPSINNPCNIQCPNDSPIQISISLGSDEASLTLNELTVLLKKLEKTVKTSQARRRAKIMFSDDEEDEEDSSKQGRSLIEDMDLDAEVFIVPSCTYLENKEGELKNVHTYTRRRTVSTGSRLVSTAGMAGVSTASGLVSTASMAQEIEINIPSPVATKDKGKDFNEEQEQERLDYEAVVRIQEELDESERQRMAQVHQATQETKKQSRRLESPTKRQKIREASGSVQEQLDEEPKADELSQEQLPQLMIIVPEEGMNVEALQTKYPIID